MDWLIGGLGNRVFFFGDRRRCNDGHIFGVRRHDRIEQTLAALVEQGRAQ